MPRPATALALVLLTGCAGTSQPASRPAPIEPTAAEDEAPAAVDPAPPAQFDQYYVVLLVRNAGASDEPTPELQELQRRHLAHIESIRESGRLVYAGPFAEQGGGPVVGMLVLRHDAFASLDEVVELARADPAVQAGRLTPDVYAWYVPREGRP